MTDNPFENQNPPDINNLISNQDTLGLLLLLRTDPNPEIRLQVAERLPELDADEIVEGLIRAYKLDPDEGVKRSARAGLGKILGSTASDAISAYGEIREDDNEFEDALLEAQGAGSEADDGDGEDYAPQVQLALENQDAQELQNLLASSNTADLRAQAAEALGELRQESSIEFLIRAVKADPEEFVRGVASASLNQLLDPDTAAAAILAYKDFDIQEYRSHFQSPSPSSLLDELDPGALETARPANIQAGPTPLTPDQASVLGSVVSDERHPDRQMKALNILSQQPSLEGNNAISSAALWSENAIVRQHAMNILKSIYGDELQSYLAEFEKSGGEEDSSEEMDLSEGDEEEEEEEAQENEEASAYPEIKSSSEYPTTQQEERSFNGLQIVLFILLIIILILLIQRFVLH